MPDDPLWALGQRLDEEVGSLARVVDGVGHALSRCGSAPDEFATRALASYVEDFYSGFERLCERVAVTLDGGVVAGEGWHRLLLWQMAASSGHGRPRLVGGTLSLGPARLPGAGR